MINLGLKAEIDALLPLLAYAEVVNGSKTAGLVAELLCYLLDSVPTAATRTVVAAMLDAIAESMKQEGLA